MMFDDMCMNHIQIGYAAQVHSVYFLEVNFTFRVEEGWLRFAILYAIRSNSAVV
jgi:hypothetical protein